MLVLQRLFKLVHRLVAKKWGKAHRLCMKFECYEYMSWALLHKCRSQLR